MVSCPSILVWLFPRLITASTFLTWGVRLLSSNQQLPLELTPSLQAEPITGNKKTKWKLWQGGNTSQCINTFNFISTVRPESSYDLKIPPQNTNKNSVQSWLNCYETNSLQKVPDPNLDSWFIPPPPQLRANLGPAEPHGEGEACFWLVSPGGGRGSCELLRLVFHLFCPMGSGGQLGLYSEYFPEREGDVMSGREKREWGVKTSSKNKSEETHYSYLGWHLCKLSTA